MANAAEEGQELGIDDARDDHARSGDGRVGARRVSSGWDEGFRATSPTGCHGWGGGIVPHPVLACRPVVATGLVNASWGGLVETTLRNLLLPC
jgi:hypothetical protein